MEAPGSNLVEGNDLRDNSVNGVELNSTFNNTIGGTVSNTGNIISGNLESGITLNAGAVTNEILGNLISGNLGSGISLTAGAGQKRDPWQLHRHRRLRRGALPNQGDGVDLAGDSNDTIGGTASGAGNVISGNKGSGINLTASATGDEVLGNCIGTQKNGQFSLPNGGDGVDLAGVNGNTIGGTAIGAGNVISGNKASGIRLTSGAVSNQVLGNFIGATADGLNDLNNGG